MACFSSETSDEHGDKPGKKGGGVHPTEAPKGKDAWDTLQINLPNPKAGQI